MYKKIIHHIVEEHFANPSVMGVAVRHYPDGTEIPASLPASYAPVVDNGESAYMQKHCGNCGAFVALDNFCKGYQATVRSDYVCATWHPISQKL